MFRSIRTWIPIYLALTIVGLCVLILNNGVSHSSSTLTATPSPTAICPPIKHEVTLTVSDDSIAVDDTFTVKVESSGFAGMTEVRLFNSYELASVPELEIAGGPLVQVLPTSQGSDIGYGSFDLKALRPGTLILSAEIYGDAFFYDGNQCFAVTHLLTLQSEPRHLYIAP